MPFCPICKTNHDPDVLCFDQTRQVLRNAGIEKASKKPMLKKEFKTLDIKAKIILILLALFFIGLAIFIARKGL